MKNSSVHFSLSFIVFIFFIPSLTGQGVAINNNNMAADPSSILDISSNNKGILLPKVELISYSDGSTIPSPAYGLIIFNNGTYIPAGFYYNEGTPAAPGWKKLKSGNAKDWTVAGNSISPGDFIEIVMTREDGKKGIAYSEFTSIAIQAIQEQQAQMKILKEQNRELYEQNQELMTRLSQLENIVASLLEKSK